MRRRRMELAYVSLLHAVPKAWRVTLALTHPRAVEPLRGVAARGCRSVLCFQPFFLIFILITTLKISSREIYFPLNNSLKINHLAGNKFPDYYADTPFQCRYQFIIYSIANRYLPQTKDNLR
jgi:hypothetical protein